MSVYRTIGPLDLFILFYFSFFFVIILSFFSFFIRFYSSFLWSLFSSTLKKKLFSTGDNW